VKIQKGKFGGPDVSKATETNQIFFKDAEGVMKATFSGAPGEVGIYKLSANQSVAYKTCSVANTQKSNGDVGWGNSHGTFHAGGKAAGQGAQIANFNPNQNKGANFPSYETAPYLIVKIGADGAPMTVIFGEGIAV
jgi:hypothetical protein